MLMLDTSVLVALREGEERVLEQAAHCSTLPLVSIISAIELENGVPFAPEGEEVRRLALDELLQSLRIVSFEQDDVAAYREITTALGFSRQKTFDRMIAAQAIVAQATLVTLNVRDFRNIPGLLVEDWSA